MLKINGIYGEAMVFTDTIEEQAENQIKELLNQPMAEGAKIRIMPDVHAGAGCVIGLTMRIKDKVCPNLVGVDIGCGVLTVPLPVKAQGINLEKLDSIVHEFVPAGFNVNEKPEMLEKQERFMEKLVCKDSLKSVDRLYQSLGTLGGGNHFVEVAADDDGNAYLCIHTGSRNLGLQVAKHYQAIAIKNNKGVSEDEVVAKIEELKSLGLHTQIPSAIKTLRATKSPVPDALACLDGEHMFDYMQDIQATQTWATINRETIAQNIYQRMFGGNVAETEMFHTVHNYIDLGWVLRKGAISANSWQTVIIPMNMRDGSIIARGKGNPEWNHSAPHGAGRLMSRKQARESLTVDDFKEKMKGVYSTTVGKSTIDEAPMAYKPMDEIVKHIGNTVEIIKVIKPIYNFKGGDAQ